MDLSVFNLLMSTNPNTTAAENIFSDAVQNSVPSPAGAGKDSLRTGEAFLQVLEQVRTGKTEKNADVLYNTLSARADAASSLKNLKKGAVSHENVKVVKLQIKRTRASETLRKADEQKTVSTTTTLQGGQKIPAQENTASVQVVSPVQPEQNDTPEMTQDIDFETFALPEQSAAPQKKILVPEEEMTAADILICSALQAVQTQAPQTTIAPVSEETNETSSFASVVLPAEKQEISVEEHAPAAAPVVRPISEKHADALNTSAKPAEKETFFKPEEASSLPLKTEFSAAKTEKTDERPSVVVLPEQENVIPFETVKQQINVAVRSETARPEHGKQQTNHIDVKEENFAADTTDVSAFDEKTVAPQARRQAEELAKALPAAEHIAVSVEVQTPAAKIFALPQNTSSRSFSIKKAGNDTEKEDSALREPEVAAPKQEKELSLQADKTEKSSSSADQTPLQTNNTPTGVAALPVQNKALPESSAQLQGQTAEIAGAPSASTTPAAAVQIGHELKGKAVSGSAPVRQNVPLNELADQIKVNIKKALKDGLDKIDIVLKPKELGTIKIHLEIGKDGSMKAVLNTARAETLDLLKSDLSVLKQALADSGFDLNEESFAFNYRGERYDDEQKHHQHRQNTFAAEDAEDDLSSDIVPVAGTLNISGRYALNIRV